MEFRLPELGEGIADATVVNVSVKAGDAVAAGQTLLEVETDKASMPIPAPAASKVAEVRVKPGDKIKIGQVVVVFARQAGGLKPPEPVSAKRKSVAATIPHPGAEPPRPAMSPSAEKHPSSAPSRYELRLPEIGEGIAGGTIVAVAVKAGDTVTMGQEICTIETDKASAPVPSPVDGRLEEIRVKSGDQIAVGSIIAVLAARRRTAEMPVSAGVFAPAPAMEVLEAASVAAAPATMIADNGKNRLAPVPAGPATRRLARELGVNLRDITGSARGGRVTIDDVKAFTRRRMTQTASANSSSGGFTVPPLPDFSKYGVVEKKPLSNLRRKIAENLTIAWHTAPAVTQFDAADITELEAGRKRIVEGLPKGEAKITMTVLAVKAVVAALKDFATFNSSLDIASGTLILKQYFHIGIAVDTERGLVVPVIRDADKKSLRALAREITELATKARGAKLAIDDMRGGCFTITNLGGIGGTAFSPIINYPEVAILGMARSSLQPVIREGKVEPRLMLPLCLTYDHRVIDGADGARFTTRLVQLFSDPIRLLMES
jgi:pyruvate dehydrogenase E2 component (dihydrolipoamide acetyltransferase)